MELAFLPLTQWPRFDSRHSRKFTNGDGWRKADMGLKVLIEPI